MRAAMKGPETKRTISTAALKAVAVRLRPTFDGSDPPQAGAVACVLIESMEPGDLEVARRAHAAIQAWARFELDTCGLVEEESRELLVAIREYAEDSGRWVFENSTWRSLEKASESAGASPKGKADDQTDRIRAQVEAIRDLVSKPRGDRPSFLDEELGSWPCSGLPFPETSMAVFCFHLAPGADQVPPPGA